MNFYKKSFAGRLSLKTVLIVSALFIATLVVVAVAGGRMMRKSSVQYSNQSITSSSLEVRSIFNSVVEITDAIGRTANEFYKKQTKVDTTSIFNLLDEVLAASPFITGTGFYFEPHKYDKKSIYAGIYAYRDEVTKGISYEWDDDESFIEDGWDYFTEEWYARVRKTGESGWTPPVVEYMTTYYQRIVTYSFPLFDDNGGLIGVFATDLSMDWLADYLVKSRPYENSNVVIVDKNSDFICNPMSDKPDEGNALKDIFVPGFKKVDRFVPSDEMENCYVAYDGLRGAFVISQKLTDDWFIAVAAPFSECLKDLYRLWSYLAALLVIGLVLMYFLTKKIIHQESRPLEDFANAASKITDGRFDVPIPEVDTEDEMKNLGDALTYMQVSVTNYISELRSTTEVKERMRSELNIANRIQAQMLNRNFPKLGEAGIYADSIPAKEVGGDLYDFYVDGKYLYFILGDVSGKGVPAALLMAITIAVFRSSKNSNLRISDIVSNINNTFAESNNDLMFVTVLAGKLDMETGHLVYCNGGHNPMLLVGPDGTANYVKCRADVACGIMEGFQFHDQEIDIQKGSTLFVYSDGVTEAERADKAQYSEERFAKWAEDKCKDGSLSCQDLVESLEQDVKAFTEGNEQSDDITVVAIKY